MTAFPGSLLKTTSFETAFQCYEPLPVSDKSLLVVVQLTLAVSVGGPVFLQGYFHLLLYTTYVLVGFADVDAACCSVGGSFRTTVDRTALSAVEFLLLVTSGDVILERRLSGIPDRSLGAVVLTVPRTLRICDCTLFNVVARRSKSFALRSAFSSSLASIVRNSVCSFVMSFR